MCDELTVKDDEEYLRKQDLTRRDFNKGAAGVALSMMLPTPDGMADGYFVYPADGAHAAVIVWPDIMGIRTSFRMMGKRLAESGYSTLVVNPYYRTAKGAVIEDGESFGTPAVRERLMPHARSLSPAMVGHLSITLMRSRRSTRIAKSERPAIA